MDSAHTPENDEAVELVADDGALFDQTAQELPEGRQYPSLYDTTPTTLAAIAIGLLIVGGIQVLVAKLYATSKSEHAYLTRFVTTLVALVMGAYIADLLIAGPDTSLLTDDEHTLILSFVKDTCLMVFSYYFGLKAQAPAAEEHSDAAQ